MRTLFDIGDDLRHLDLLLEEAENTGDQDKNIFALSALMEWLNDLQNEQQEKLERYRQYILRLETEAAVAKSEKEQYQKMQQSRENRVEWLKTRLKEYFQQRGIDKAVTSTGRTISVQLNGGKVGIEYSETLINLDEIPQEFIKKELNKEAVREALESGRELGFAKLAERGKSLRIR